MKMGQLQEVKKQLAECDEDLAKYKDNDPETFKSMCGCPGSFRGPGRSSWAMCPVAHGAPALLLSLTVLQARLLKRASWLPTVGWTTSTASGAGARRRSSATRRSSPTSSKR